MTNSTPPPADPASAPSRLLDRLRHHIRIRHYSQRTEEAYVHWVRRYIRFHGRRRMRHAHINKMRDADTPGRANRLLPRPLIDRNKLLGFRRAGVRHTHQLNKCVAAPEM